MTCRNCEQGGHPTWCTHDLPPGVLGSPGTPVPTDAGTQASGAPGHTLCDYEDCDQEPTVTLPRGAVMCAHHAAVSLLASMSPEEAKSTFRFARPVPEDPWAADAEPRCMQCDRPMARFAGPECSGWTCVQCEPSSEREP